MSPDVGQQPEGQGARHPVLPQRIRQGRNQTQGSHQRAAAEAGQAGLLRRLLLRRENENFRSESAAGFSFRRCQMFGRKTEIEPETEKAEKRKNRADRNSTRLEICPKFLPEVAETTGTR